MRKKLIILSALCLFLCLACFSAYFILRGGRSPEAPEATTATPTAAAPTEAADQTTALEVTTKAPYKSPIDFQSLQKRNADVYAWLEIPGTTISEPVAQSPTDDNQYLRHDLDGNYTIAGTLFTEHAYNGTSFDDIVTIIYGHHMLDDTMFGNLQMYYSDEETFREYENITVYQPEKELHYQVIAAVPYGNQHILYYHKGFPTTEEVESFLSEIYQIRGFGVNRRDRSEIESTDRFLILSTCLQGNRNKRYLVIARLTGVLS